MRRSSVESFAQHGYAVVPCYQFRLSSRVDCVCDISYLRFWFLRRVLIYIRSYGYISACITEHPQAVERNTTFLVSEWSSVVCARTFTVFECNSARPRVDELRNPDADPSVLGLTKALSCGVRVTLVSSGFPVTPSHFGALAGYTVRSRRRRPGAPAAIHSLRQQVRSQSLQLAILHPRSPSG